MNLKDSKDVLSKEREWEIKHSFKKNKVKKLRPKKSEGEKLEGVISKTVEDTKQCYLLVK